MEVPDLSAILSPCPVLPLDSYANCCGVFATSSFSMAELRDAFPSTWEGKPLSSIGLSARPPGLAFRYDRTMRLYLVFADPDGFFFFEPPIMAGHGVAVDSVFVTWPPLPPSEYQGTTSFGTWEMFFLEHADTSFVRITATVNLTATYALPGDTVLVWGTAIGMPDIELTLTGLATPTSVTPTTWGRIKHDALRNCEVRRH
jgi:hypothetical protein